MMLIAETVMKGDLAAVAHQFVDARAERRFQAAHWGACRVCSWSCSYRAMVFSRPDLGLQLQDAVEQRASAVGGQPGT